MKKKLIKGISLFLSCFALTLVLNATTAKTNHSNPAKVHLDESAPWG